MTMPTTDNTHRYEPISVPSYGGNSHNEGASATALALNEQFIAPTGVDTPSSEAQPYLEVVAPATLPEVRNINIY